MRRQRTLFEVTGRSNGGRFGNRIDVARISLVPDLIQVDAYPDQQPDYHVLIMQVIEAQCSWSWRLTITSHIKQMPAFDRYPPSCLSG